MGSSLPYPVVQVRSNERAEKKREQVRQSPSLLSFDEPTRLQKLYSYGILDTPPEEIFDRMTRLATRLLEVPAALITFVDQEKIWSKSRYGQELIEIPHSEAFGVHALLADSVLVIEDTQQDAQFAHFPYTVDGSLRFYAGAPLQTKDGFILGALCVIDQIPRVFTQAQKETLVELAGFVVTELDLRFEIKARQDLLCLHRIGKAILSASSVQEIASTTVDYLTDLVPYEIASVCELDYQENQVLVLASNSVGSPRLPLPEHLPLSLFSHLRSMQSGKVHYVDDLRLHKNLAPLEKWLCQSGMRAYVSVPLLVQGKLCGFLNVASLSVAAYGDREIHILQEVAEMVAVAIHQARYEACLIEAKERAEEMNRLKSTFLANMSHEIRTPLVSILGFSEIVAEEVTGATAHHVDLVRKAGQRLMSTLDSVLDLAKLESRSIRLNPRLLDVASQVGETLTLFSHQIKERGLKLHWCLPQHPVYICVDQAALTRVLNNLLSNAIKFTQHGYIAVSLIADRDAVEIWIEDSGVGIDDAFLPHIFEEFKQESQGARRTFEGVGLGMTITKHLVDLMQGDITVTSQKGHGSTFVVRLPVEPALAEPMKLAKTPAVSPNLSLDNRRPRLLFVEDQSEVRTLVKLMLKEHYELVSVPTVAEALIESDRCDYHLFLIDIHLGETCSGVDLLKLLRLHPRYASTPCVVCTSYALPGDREQFLAHGFDAYVSKPFSKSDLLKTLERLLKQEGSIEMGVGTGEQTVG